jgi:hypothetical protein
LFAASSGLFFLSLYGLLPALRRHGVSWFAAFNLVLALPLALLSVAAVVACRWEGYALSWPALRDRLRLGRPSLSAWLWTVALSIFMYGGRWAGLIAFAAAVSGVFVEAHGSRGRAWRWVIALAAFLILSQLLWYFGPRLQTIPLHPRPECVAELLSHFGPDDFMGIPLAGRWWLAVYYAAVLLFGNVAGEELWWRGYVLPRQELAHGAAAWLVHGALWAAFHLFFQWSLWDLVRMVPTCCALAFVAQHCRNTWPGVVGHTFGNSGLLIQIVRGAFGG